MCSSVSTQAIVSNAASRHGNGPGAVRTANIVAGTRAGNSMSCPANGRSGSTLLSPTGPHPMSSTLDAARAEVLRQDGVSRQPVEHGA